MLALRLVPGGRRGGPRRASGGLRLLGAVQLEQVVGAAQQLPLGLAGGKPPAQEPPRPLLLLELAEDRLDHAEMERCFALLVVAGCEAHVCVLQTALGLTAGRAAISLGAVTTVLAGLDTVGNSGSFTTSPPGPWNCSRRS